jgi:2,4-dienoyl-CoA reductase-like NADH-dependent reductase (Old Yellow Enzyme family)
MEGWDGTTSGGATELVTRRWRRFGESGAKLIWGCEAMAIRPDARANPNQLIISEETESDLSMLRNTLVQAHRDRYDTTDDMLIGFQLTHSGRFCKPWDKTKFASRVAYRHPILDRKFGVTSDEQVFGDDELGSLVSDYVKAAKIAQNIGADFVDIKHCHGYLLHEFLSAKSRSGCYGGSFENRTRLLREITAGIRAEVPGMLIGVRLSAFDIVPYKPDVTKNTAEGLGPGIPEDFSAYLPYLHAFGVNETNPVEYDLTETRRFLELLEELDIRLVNITAGSPYYNPHIQRPALRPPSDGYAPPEDPLAGVARHINVTRYLKACFPRLFLIGTGYTYLQEYLPHVAQYYLRHGHVDAVGIGRMVLTYPQFFSDATTTGKLDAKIICRTLSDCTTGPRKGLPSGCYPLDDFYKKSELAAQLKILKKGA